MTSLQTHIRQNTPQFFMPLSSLTGVIYAYNPAAGSVQFSTAPWADNTLATPGGPRFGGRYLSSINVAGAGLLRDLGKQVVSGGRTFRKVELVVRQTGSNSTFGVEGQALGTVPNADYLTGYIEFGFEGTGQPAPVAQYGRL
jgi:hypothetical protein